jgi:hypothetical protein
MTNVFEKGDQVRHLVTQEVGIVERGTAEGSGYRVTVRFPKRWRASVVAAKNLVHVKYETQKDAG